MRPPLLGSVVALALAGSLGVAQAQTVVHSTFGPGDAFNPFIGWSLGPTGVGGRQSIAGFFTYGLGDPMALDYFRVALSSFDPPAPIVARFLTGADVNTATELESFSRTIQTSGFGASIFTFNSLLRPMLTPGETYWVALSMGASTTENGVWNQNNRGFTGVAYRLTDDGSWVVNPTGVAPAFDVAASTVPEPLGTALLATGLGGLGALRWRRRKKDAMV